MFAGVGTCVAAFLHPQCPCFIHWACMNSENCFYHKFYDIHNFKNQKIFYVFDNSYILYRGFGGLGVACWPLVPKFAGSNPAEAVGFFRAKKILSTPSFGGEVKPSVPCRRFAACKRSLNLRGSRNLGKNYRTTFSPAVPPFAARISCVVADVQAPGGESGNI